MFEQNTNATSTFINEPSNLSGWQVAGKTLLGFLVGLMLAMLMFVIMILVGESFQFFDDANSVIGAGNPMLPLVFIIIAFLITLIGNVVVTGAYNVFYSNKYYDASKMFSMVLLINILLFFIFAPIYLVFYDDKETLRFVLVFHIMFSTFVSYSLIEFTTNPNYSGVHLIGTTLGLSISLLMFFLIYRAFNTNQSNIVQILFLLPMVLVYTFIPLFHAIREKIYYKFYEVGNNFLYISSINEVLVDSEEEDEINVVE